MWQSDRSLLVGAAMVFASWIPRTTAGEPPAPAWPLPLIKDAALQASSDFRGVLLRTQAGTIQIESVRWAITDRGELFPMVLDAYGRDGKYQRYAGLPGQARSFDRTADLHDFLVRSEGRLVRVGHARIGADAEGYLTILDYEGIDEATGSPVVFSRKPPPAAISTVPDEIVECHMTDTRTYCEDDHCGPSCFQSTYPDCRCTAGTGSCRNVLESGYCEGWCPTGYFCNGDGSGACRCEQWRYPPEPTTPPPPQPPVDPVLPSNGNPNGSKSLQSCPPKFQLDPETGKCKPCANC